MQQSTFYYINTKTNGIVYETYPNKQRHAYRNDYVCTVHKRQNMNVFLENNILTKTELEIQIAKLL